MGIVRFLEGILMKACPLGSGKLGLYLVLIKVNLVITRSGYFRFFGKERAVATFHIIVFSPCYLCFPIGRQQ
ncbi:hypothetical protein D3C87_1289940 [compost metagenome]